MYLMQPKPSRCWVSFLNPTYDISIVSGILSVNQPMLLPYIEQVYIERIEQKLKPFDNPQVGDMVKPI
jgi:hypothetical protein